MGKALDQLEKIRKSGMVNMMNGKGVLKLANENGYSELVVAISNDLGKVNKKEFLKLLQKL